MAWSTPPTFASGQTITSAFLNALRDNLNETAVAKATASGRIVVSSGPKQMAERIPSTGYIGTTETNSSTSFVNLTTFGPDVTVTTGTQALMMLTTGMSNSTVNAECFYGYSCSGATTINANTQEAVRFTSATSGAQFVGTWAYIIPLTAGVNAFRARYMVSSGQGTWFDRRLSVLPF